ncbi:MAG: DMT family transporter [Thermoplasmata archaeon]|jgi:drug/metabolite transporter (DMT)-like permease
MEAGETPVRRSTQLLGLGLLLVLLTALISGVSTFVNIYAVSGTNSDAFVTVRNGMVALMLVPLAFVTTLGVPRATLRRVDWARLVTIGIVGGGIPFLLFFYGLQLATVNGGGVTASFLYRTLFIFATVFGIFYLKERFHWRIVLVVTLLLGGDLLLLSLTSPVWTDGSLFVLAATVLWAVEYTISKRTLRDLPSGTVALGRMGFGAIFLICYLGATAQFSAVGTLNGGQWSWVVISAILLTAFCAAWYAGLQHVDLGVASAVLVLGFPITWLLSVAVAGSSFTILEVVGAVAIAGGVVVAVGTHAFRSTWEYVRSSAWFRPST